MDIFLCVCVVCLTYLLACGLVESKCGFYVYTNVLSLCVFGVFCRFRKGCVYRVSPSRAQISDPCIPKPPLIASVCRNLCCISHRPISSVCAHICICALCPFYQYSRGFSNIPFDLVHEFDTALITNWGTSTCRFRLLFFLCIFTVISFCFFSWWAHSGLGS